VFRIANRKLCGVHGDGDTASAGGAVIAGQGCLTAFVEAARGIERQRVRGNDESIKEPAPEITIRTCHW
jgi:hypothetical protein